MGATAVATDRSILRAGLRLLAAVALVLSAGMGLPLAPGAVAGASGGPNPAYDLDQCANGGVGDPDEQCADAQWVNGNLNHTKAHYNEGESVPYRARLSDLDTAVPHTLLIEWDTTDTADGLHALDYLTSYNRTETNALACSGVAGCSEASFSTYPIPADLVMQSQPDWIANGGSQVPGVFTLFGGTITGASAYGFSGSWDDHSATSIAVTFTASVSNPVLAWGGHIASRQDWGMDHSAVSISGSPFHMRIMNLDGSGGNQDRSLSNEAVIFPAYLTIVKDAVPDSSTVFPFTASPAPLPASFELVDDGSPAAPVPEMTFTVSTFGTFTVTEGAVAGWALSGLSCSGSEGIHTDLQTRTATIEIEEADLVTCTFTNTANAATISVVKTATPSTVLEPGGPVTFDVVVTNESTLLDVTIDSLLDSVHGDLDGEGTCDVPQTIAPLGTYSCSFTATVSGDAGDVETDVVTATGEDELGNPVSDFDDATVTITDVLPLVVTAKSANPGSLPEPGGTATFTVSVTNPASAIEPIWLASLVDSVYGDLDGVGTCDVSPPVELAPGASYTCSFAGAVAGDAGSVHTDVVTATAWDNEENSVTAHDDASVTITDVLPAIQVVKSASPTLVHAGDSVTYTYLVTNLGIEPLSDVTLTDDKCSSVTYVSGDVNDDDLLDVTETWTFRCVTTLSTSTVNTVVASGEDNEGNKATDTDTASVTVINPALSIVKTASPAAVVLGASVTYTYVVTNKGDVPLTSVVVTDDKCSPLTFVGGDTDGDAALDLTETWTYTCTATPAAAGALTNVGTVNGTDVLGKTVTAQDTETVQVTAVLGEVLQRELPRTGVDADRLTALGAGLMGMGLFLVLGTHRRRVHAS